jgi:hypothetical protein
MPDDHFIKVSFSVEKLFGGRLATASNMTISVVQLDLVQEKWT